MKQKCKKKEREKKERNNERKGRKKKIKKFAQKDGQTQPNLRAAGLTAEQLTEGIIIPLIWHMLR